ncbi:endospore germination permease [Cohnella sp. CFH 77786]|uniref:GerAB/ArcD/ProY family transporter n=1 Tax=Cohnella sp. CFH 77786 TaxID=2662265 RepID=UPI001C60F673
MEKSAESISSTGLGALLFMFLMGSSMTVPLAAIAGHDAWISIILALAVSSGIVWIYTRLCLHYPGKSLVEIARELLGAWGGGIMALLYAWYALHLGSLVLRNFTELINTVALQRTPPFVVSAVMIGMVLWAAYGGIEVIARCALALIWFVLSEGIVSMLLMSKDFQAANLLPVVDRGWMPILEGMTELVGFPFGESVLFAMIIPALNRIGQANKTMLRTLFAAGALLIMVNIRNFLILGDMASKLVFPSYTAYQYISLADFIERVEPILIITWLMGGFSKISVCLYVCAKSLSAGMASTHYRPYLVPMGLLMLEFSLFVHRNNAEQIQFAVRVWQWYSFPFQIAVPLALLMLASFAKRKREPPPDGLAAAGGVKGE